MYPTWLINVFIDNFCTQCRNPITPNDITAIALARPEDYVAHLREPFAIIVAKCSKCGQKHSFQMRCTKDLLFEAMGHLAKEIESAPVKNPPLFGPGSVASSLGKSSSQTDNAGNSVQPSLRANQKTTPLSQEEIREFLLQLKRMSFKAGSRSLKKLAGNNPIMPTDDKDETNTEDNSEH